MSQKYIHSTIDKYIFTLNDQRKIIFIPLTFMPVWDTDIVNESFFNKSTYLAINSHIFVIIKTIVLFSLSSLDLVLCILLY